MPLSEAKVFCCCCRETEQTSTGKFILRFIDAYFFNSLKNFEKKVKITHLMYKINYLLVFQIFLKKKTPNKSSSILHFTYKF